jgi:psiF repeat-containing protein
MPRTRGRTERNTRDDGPSAPSAGEDGGVRDPESAGKMKKCNADASAKALKGDERKTFMSSCLKGQPASSGSRATALIEAAAGGAARNALPGVRGPGPADEARPATPPAA